MVAYSTRHAAPGLMYLFFSTLEVASYHFIHSFLNLFSSLDIISHCLDVLRS